MCTAITYKTNTNFYFGRTLDYDFSYNEEITITPRNFPFNFRENKTINTHYAIIGMAYIYDNYPLYYDAMNEKGLCMAGLNFVGNAKYEKNIPDKTNVASFEFIPWVLSQCSSVAKAKSLLKNLNITDVAFSESLPPSELHWLIADKYESITVEQTKNGLQIYQNSVGILTNNPTFNEQMFQLNNYMHLSPKPPQNLFSEKLNLQAYSRGMGALGLPGDWSSQSRFVRAVFIKLNSPVNLSEPESLNQFFHITDSVTQIKGCCQLENNNDEITIYTSCCDTNKGIYYYTTYNDRNLSYVDMYKENLSAKQLISYSLNQQQNN